MTRIYVRKHGAARRRPNSPTTVSLRLSVVVERDVAEILDHQATVQGVTIAYLVSLALEAYARVVRPEEETP